MTLLRKLDRWLRRRVAKKLTPTACTYCHTAIGNDPVSPQLGFVFCDFTCQMLYRDLHRERPTTTDYTYGESL